MKLDTLMSKHNISINITLTTVSRPNILKTDIFFVVQSEYFVCEKDKNYVNI